jgi:hypothetical protein
VAGKIQAETGEAGGIVRFSHVIPGVIPK